MPDNEKRVIRFTVLLTAEEWKDLQGRAGLVPVGAWVRAILFRATTAVSDETVKQIEKAKSVGVTNEVLRDAEVEQERQKNSETRVKVERPKWRPRRGHASDDPGVRESRGGKCGYMAKPGKKCPACGTVHS